MRNINDAGMAILKEFEGCSLTVYTDIAGYPTVGWGHRTNSLPVGSTITQDQADDFLDEDLLTFEDLVDEAVTRPINDNQFSAIICLVYNIGFRAFKNSTLLRILNDNVDFDVCASQFLMWDHINGEQSDGLLRRRRAEQALFLS